MSQSNWLRYAASGIAALAVLAALYIGLSAWLVPGVPLPSPETHNAATESQRPHSEQCEATSLQQIRSRTRRERESARCNDEADRRAREVEDLDQQTRSANAAEWTAYISVIQLRVSLAETLFLLLTLLATAAAAWAAVIAARAAQTATAVAEREFLEGQRPEFAPKYDQHSIAEWLTSAGHMTGHVRFYPKNIGGRQAIVTFYDSEFFIADIPPVPSRDCFKTPPSEGHMRVEPDKDFILTPVAQTLEAEDKRAIFEGEKYVFVVGYIEYTDRLEGKWENGFCYQYAIWGTSRDRVTHEIKGVLGTLNAWGGTTYNFDRARKVK